MSKRGDPTEKRENLELLRRLRSRRRDGVEGVEGLANAGILKCEQEDGQGSRGGRVGLWAKALRVDFRRKYAEELGGWRVGGRR